jgi:hypothetical protein
MISNIHLYEYKIYCQRLKDNMETITSGPLLAILAGEATSTMTVLGGLCAIFGDVMATVLARKKKVKNSFS